MDTATRKNRASHAALVVKHLPANAGGIRDVNSIPGPERFPGGQDDNPLQYSCLENPMDRGVLQATVHGIAGLDMMEVTEHACMLGC